MINEKLTILIDLSKQVAWENRKLQEKLGIKDHLDIIQWMSDFCTIRLNVGRSVGISSYIIDNAMAFDLVIVPTEEIRRFYIFMGHDEIHIHTLRSLHSSKKGRSFGNCSYVYVDDYSDVFSNEKLLIHGLYRVFEKYESLPMFMFLGK